MLRMGNALVQDSQDLLGVAIGALTDVVGLALRALNDRLAARFGGARDLVRHNELFRLLSRDFEEAIGLLFALRDHTIPLLLNLPGGFDLFGNRRAQLVNDL